MHSVSLNVSQLFFTPDVGTWLHVELCQTDGSVSVGTVRKKQFSFFFNFEMNKSTTAEKIKIKFSKFQFFFLPFSENFGGDSVKQLNKFVWPNAYKISWQSLENWLTGYQKANFHFGPSSTVGQIVERFHARSISHFCRYIRPEKKYCLFPVSDRPYQRMCDPNLFYRFKKKNNNSGNHNFIG